MCKSWPLCKNRLGPVSQRRETDHCAQFISMSIKQLENYDGIFTISYFVYTTYSLWPLSMRLCTLTWYDLVLYLWTMWTMLKLYSFTERTLFQMVKVNYSVSPCRFTPCFYRDSHIAHHNKFAEIEFSYFVEPPKTHHCINFATQRHDFHTWWPNYEHMVFTFVVCFDHSLTFNKYCISPKYNTRLKTNARVKIFWNKFLLYNVIPDIRPMSNQLQVKLNLKKN